MMLYTERAHFYNRYRVRGIKEIIFYGLPLYAHFYPEIINFLEVSNSQIDDTGRNVAVTVFFTRLDKLKLDRIVGSSRSNRILSIAEKTNFVFV